MPKSVLVAISYLELGGVYRFVGKVMGVNLMSRYSLNEFPNPLYTRNRLLMKYLCW